MTARKRIHEFYLKVPLVALALLAGCAVGQYAPEPVPVPGSTTVYLVRHAEKSSKNPNDPDPDISASGRARAKALATRLGGSGVTAIIVTQFKRTQETAEPLADSLHITPDVIPAGHVGDTDSAAAAVYSHRGSKVLIVGHSYTLAPIIAALGGPKVPVLCEGQYSTLYILYIPPTGDPQLTRQRYGAGDLAPDASCLAMGER